MERDSVTEETFLRVVGRRRPRPFGVPLTAEARAALESLQPRRTRAPKGIFLYANHEEMDADRLRWTVAAMVERARGL